MSGAVCGQPMKFYNLDRPRDDFAPTCHRRPHTGKRHMSRASVQHARQHRAERDRERRKATRERRPP